MSFANPYNFVGTKVIVDRKKMKDIKNHTRIVQKETYTGILTCSLKTLTKLFIPSPEDMREERIGTDRFGRPIKHTIFESFYYIRKNDTKSYAIPASSLKGVIRSVAEAISNSCLHIFDGKYERGRVLYSIDKALQKEQCVFYDEEGNLANGLCICCSMFGMANAKESKETAAVEETRKTPNVFRGKIIFSDLMLKTPPSFEPTFPLNELLSPKPRHRAFYADGESIKGRKFYYHHPAYEIGKLKGLKTGINRSITPLKKDAVFKFTISFENLTKEEYALLLTTLELEPGLGHKIGMGKPLGLGSCVIEITEIKEFRQERYLSINKCAEKVFKNDELNRRKDEIKKWRTSEIPQDLRCILKISPGFTEIRYPIKDIRNSHRDEFSRYKKLHPPCREFSPDDKGSGRTITYSEQKKSERPGKSRPEGLGSMAEALKKAKKK